jgi:hypothetical protein
MKSLIILWNLHDVRGVPSFRIFKMLDPAIHISAGVNRVSWNNLQTNMVLHSDSSSHRVGF